MSNSNPDDLRTPAAPTAAAASTTSDPAALRAEVERLSRALEDIVALADSGGDERLRRIQMQRRAIAALTRADGQPKGQPTR